MAADQKTPVDNSGYLNLSRIFLGQTGSNTGGQTTQNSGALTNTGTVTTSESVSPDAVNALVRSILEGTNGLAAVSQGQRTAGLYNSSTNQLLANDLITRTAGQAAALNRSSTVANNTVQADTRGTTQASVGTTRQDPQVKPGTAVGILGGLQAAGQVAKLVPDGGLKKLLQALGVSNQAAQGGNAVFNAAKDSQAANEQLGINTSATNSVVSQGAEAATPGISIAAPETLPESASAGVDSYTPEAATTVDPGVDFNSGLDFSSSAPAAGEDLVSGLGDYVSSGQFGTDIGLDASSISAFDNAPSGDELDLLLGFADGGLVSKESLFERRKAAIDSATDASSQGKDTNTAYQARMGEQPAPNPAPKESDTTSTFRKLFRFAEGGLIDLTDTGLRRNLSSSPQSSTAINAVVQAINGNSTPATISTSTPTPTTRTNAAGQTSSAQTTGRARGNADGEGGGSGAGSVGTAIDGVSINRGDVAEGTNFIGDGPALGSGARLGLSLASALGGVPGTGSIIGLAGAKDRDAAIKSMAIGALSIVNPVLGLTVKAVDAFAPSILSALGLATPATSTPDNGLGGGVGTVGDAATGPGTLGARDSIVTNDSAVGSNTVGGSGFAGSVGFGGGIGGSGNSAGGAGSSDSSNSGATSTAATGGKVSGPGSGTSDSIPIHVSNGEYVIRKNAVDVLGADFLDMINALGIPNGR